MAKSGTNQIELKWILASLYYQNPGLQINNKLISTFSEGTLTLAKIEHLLRDVKKAAKELATEAKAKEANCEASAPPASKKRGTCLNCNSITNMH